MLLKDPSLSGRKNTSVVSSLSLMTFISKLGRKKYCLKRAFPCVVRAKRWNNPYIERPSFEPRFVFVGP